MVECMFGQIKGPGSARGINHYGELGVGVRTICITKPHKCKLDNVSKVYCGPSYMFILTKDSKLYATGYNLQGQLGIGCYYNVYDPVFIPISNVSNIVCGESHSLILTKAGKLLVAGSNRNFQLRPGTRASSNFKELDISDLGKISRMTTNNLSTFIITEDNKIHIWNNVLEEKLSLITRIPSVDVTAWHNNKAIITLTESGKVYIYLQSTRDLKYCGASRIL